MPRLSSEFFPNELAERPSLCPYQVPLLVLRVHIQHVERLLARHPVVDDAQPTPLARPRPRPAHLPQRTLSVAPAGRLVTWCSAACSGLFVTGHLDAETL